MKLKLEYLAGCGTFSECRFRTPFYEKEVSGLAFICRSGPAVWEPQSLLLVCGGLIPSGREPLALWLDERKGSGAAGFLADLSGEEEERIDALAKACRERELVFGTVAAERFASLINEYSHLIASRTDGTVRAYDRVLEDLQHRFYTSGTDSLLDGLSYWTGCQAALIVGQDTFVKPPVPVLNEAVFYPAYWRKEPQKSPLSHVSLYSSSYSEKMLLQAELFKNRLPFGVLCLIGEEGRFEPSDYILLNYASILCTGIDDYKRRSRRIEAAMEMICGGQMPDSSVTNLFPESGYALVLREQETDGAADGKKEYLSYLIHHYFPQQLCYSFSAEGSLRLFVSTEDVDHFGRRLLDILDGAGKRCRAGVSRYYTISQAVTAFFEAESAAHIAGLLEYGERICYYHDLGIYRLLNYPENSWPINQMLGEMDELLNQMDEEKRDVLAMTVRVFVKCKFNYQKTADKLYTHVNTVRYRIKLIEDLWDADLSSDEGRLLFSVLAKLLPLWMKSGCYSGTLPREGE